MTFQRDRFLDDSGIWHVSLELRSRTGQMHSLMSGLTTDERAAVSAALAHALDAVVPLLRQRMSESNA